MNNKNRKFNFVDVCLLLIALCVITVFLSMLFSGASKIDFTPKETITLTMRVRNIPIKHSSYIANGNEIYFADDESLLGTVKYASYDFETVEFTDKLTNTSTTYKAPDKKAALLLIEAKAEIKDGNFYVAGRKLEKADTVNLFVPSYSFTATIINIESGREWFYEY